MSNTAAASDISAIPDAAADIARHGRRTASRLVAVPTHAGAGKVTVLNPSATSKRPRPFVRPVDQADLDWDPVLVPQYLPDLDTQATMTGDEPPAMQEGQFVRAGDGFCVINPNNRRWPLGHVSDVYKISSHRLTADAIMTFAADNVEPFDRPLASGHGYRVVHQFAVRHEKCKRTVAGIEITSRLTVVHDHTGLHAMKACLVIYCGDSPLGSIVFSRAIHSGNNPETWRADVTAMVEKAILAQDALCDLIEAANVKKLGEGDKAVLSGLKIKPAGKEEWQPTLLAQILRWMVGRSKEITWGIWERRCSDRAIIAMCKVLGVKKFGQPLDEALGNKKRYGR